jgi:tetrahydromethanopterin S-methyltransferase subunit H
MKAYIDVRTLRLKPRDLISIKWEVSNPVGSGSTECEAWRWQYEIEKLEQSEYKVVGVSRHE